MLVVASHGQLNAARLRASRPKGSSTPEEGPAGWSVEELEYLFQEEGTDKQAREPGHSYVHTYASVLGPWRHTIRSMVEIGIGTLGKAPANMRYWWYAMQTYKHVNARGPNTRPRDRSYQPGASLRAWRRYFAPHTRIIGLDIDHLVVAKAKETPGIEAFVANASEPAQLAKVLPTDLDLIIDDGDHVWVAQQRTLLNMWPFLRPGGYYFIEDVMPDEFHNQSMANAEAHDLMDRVGATLILPDPIHRAHAAAGRHKKGGLKLDLSHLVLLRKPTREEAVNVKTRLPADG